MTVFTKLGKAPSGIGSQVLQRLPGQQPNGGFNPLNTVKCCLADLCVDNHQHGFAAAQKLDDLFFSGEKPVQGPVLPGRFLIAGKIIDSDKQ